MRPPPVRSTSSSSALYWDSSDEEALRATETSECSSSATPRLAEIHPQLPSQSQSSVSGGGAC